MKKILSLLLGLLMIISITAYAGVAFAQKQEDNFRPAAMFDDEEFAQMTPQKQYEYLMSLGSEEEIQQALSQLNSDQLAALEIYRLSAEAQPSEPTASEGQPAPDESDQTADGTNQTADETGQTVDGTGQPDGEVSQAPDVAKPSGVDYSAMTPQQLYEYLFTLGTDEEIDAVLSALTPEQYAALDAYALGVAEAKLETSNPAQNYTNAGKFMDPVYVLVPMMAKAFAAQAAVASTDEEDALVLDKRVSDSNGHYLLTIDAYATGEVNITTGERPVPADIILVLDVSLSMDENMISGYNAVSYATNSAAYNARSGLLVKVGNQYYAVTISVSGNRYTYRYTGSSGQVTEPSNGSNGTPPNWSFFKATTTTRIAALRAAANSFIDSIEGKANAGEGVDHRIAVVTYSDAATIISGNGNNNGAFVNAKSNVSGINTLQGAVNNLDSDRYTRSDLGLQRAVNIFQSSPPAASGLRNRVVVFFTDGAPCSSGNGAYQEAVANPAVANAKTLKTSASATPAGYGATVYSIGIFDGANPATPIGSASNENKFMHYVSSNYPEASSMSSPGSVVKTGYYLSASDTTGLNNIFQSISENIETGGTTVTLDDESVIRDQLAPYFELLAGTDEDDIKLYTCDVDSSGHWLGRNAFNGSVSISEDGETIDISGFDFHNNYYAPIKTNGVITGYKGKKLVIEIPIQYITGSCFGGRVPTNKPTSGVYDDDYLVEPLPIPTVDLPVNYNFTPLNQPIYLSQNAAINGTFTTAPGYVADGVNNAYVNIVYTVKSGSTVLGTYTIPAKQTSGTWNISDFVIAGLTANTAYTVDCTVTPVCTEITPGLISKPATVFMWKPEVTWKDSVIYLGETANYSNNYGAVAWKNSVTGAPSPAGVAPTLQYEFAPAQSAFTDDTHVRVTVKIGSFNVTAFTAFVHAPCSVPGCAFSPALGQFMVHVKSCSLTITKAGASDPTDTFIFTVTGGGRSLRVSVQGNGSQTIVGLPVGTYTVAEEGKWSWRYTAPDAHITLDAAHASGGVTVSNNQTDNQWLSGDSHAVNTFPDAD